MIHTDLTPDQETQAALYVLGTLAPEEARAFEAHLTEDGCAVCRAQVEAMRGVCDDLAIAPAPRAPSAAVRARVLADAGRAVTVEPPSFAFNLADGGTWTEVHPGVEIKMLSTPRGDDKSSSYLIRAAPGTSVPSHVHDSFEHAFLISGDVFMGGRHMRAGDYHYAPRGSVHDTLRSDGGCLILIVEAR